MDDHQQLVWSDAALCDPADRLHPALVEAEQLAAAYVDDQTLMTAEQLEAMNAVRMNPS
jgi:hypothetical protein